MQATDGQLTISTRGNSATGFYLFRGRRRTLDGRITGDGLSGSWTEDQTAAGRGGGGSFSATFDSRQHTLEVRFFIGRNLAGRSTWSCKPDTGRPTPSQPPGGPPATPTGTGTGSSQSQFPNGKSENHDTDNFRTFDALPKEKQEESLKKRGPRLPQRYNFSDFSTRVFVAGGWPIELQYSLDSDAPGRLTISTEGVAPIVVNLEPTRSNAIRLNLPAEFPAKPQVGKLSVTAFRSDGSPARFRLHALAMGERGVQAIHVFRTNDRYRQLALSREPSSPDVEPLRLFPPSVSTINVSVDNPIPPTIKPGVKPKQLIKFSLLSQSLFDNGRWELWKVDGLDWVEVWQEKTGTIQPNQKKENHWDGIISWRKMVSPGDHALQVTAWHGREEDNSWVVAQADPNLTVIP